MKNVDEISEDEERRRGELIAEVLGYKKRGGGYYHTKWGTKTDLGLFRVMKRIVLEGE